LTLNEENNLFKKRFDYLKQKINESGYKDQKLNAIIAETLNSIETLLSKVDTWKKNILESKEWRIKTNLQKNSELSLLNYLHTVNQASRFLSKALTGEQGIILDLVGVQESLDQLFGDKQ
jgi:hypothetical protein